MVDLRGLFVQAAAGDKSEPLVPAEAGSGSRQRFVVLVIRDACRCLINDKLVEQGARLLGVEGPAGAKTIELGVEVGKSGVEAVLMRDHRTQRLVGTANAGLHVSKACDRITDDSDDDDDNDRDDGRALASRDS